MTLRVVLTALKALGKAVHRVPCSHRDAVISGLINREAP